MTKNISPHIPLHVFLLVVIAFAAAAYLRNGIYASPLTLWKNVVERTPTKARPHANYGYALAEAGRYEEALGEYDKASTLHDGSLRPEDFYREVGVVYFRMGRSDDAITAWQKGLQIAPLDGDLLDHIAIGYMRSNDIVRAMFYAEKARAASPSMASPLNTLGELYIAKGDYVKAVDVFMKAIELDPDKPLRFFNAAFALEKVGRYDDAYRYMNIYAVMMPDEGMRKLALSFMERVKMEAQTSAGRNAPGR